MHNEVRTDTRNHIFLSGLSYPLGNKNINFIIQSLVRYDTSINLQCSAVYGYINKYFDVYGYIDIYGENINVYNENRIYVNMIDNVAVGTVIDIGTGMKTRCYLGIRYIL